MYDAGRLGSPRAGVRPIAAYLWSRGIRRIETAIISHADADHFNALPGLMERFAVGQVCVSPFMFDSQAPAISALRQAIRASPTPVKILRRGDSWSLGGDVRARVRHPPAMAPSGSDNADSIVLQISGGGREILLTGDLEPPGLKRLLNQPALRCEGLMAPHHGSSHSDPAALAAWARPRWVVISDGHGRDTELTRRVYEAAGAKVAHTARDGAARISVYPQGTQLRTWGRSGWQ
jgi:competence protein ComEC